MIEDVFVAKFGYIVYVYFIEIEANFLVNLAIKENCLII